MQSAAETISTALTLVDTAIQSNDTALTRSAMEMLTEGTINAISTKQFHLVEIANETLRQHFNSGNIIPRVKSKEVSESILALLLERVAPAPNRIWNAGVEGMSETLATMLVENCFKFLPYDHDAHSQLNRQFLKPHQQNVRAVVFESYIANALTVVNEKRESPFKDIDLIWDAQNSSYAKGSLSTPVLRSFISNKGMVIKQIKSEMKALRGKNARAENLPLALSVLQQLHDEGFSGLASLMSPEILKTNNTPRRFLLAEALGVEISKQFLTKVLTKSRHEEYTLGALVYALESKSVSHTEFEQLLIDEKTVTPTNEAAFKAQTKHFGSAIQAVYDHSKRAKNALVHEKTSTLLNWMDSLSRSYPLARKAIANTVNLPAHFLHEHPGLLEDKLSKDLGL